MAQDLRGRPPQAEQFLSGMIQVYGPDLLRYKGVLWMKGNPRRVVFQGVHMMMGGDMGKPCWGEDKKRSVMVFIGKKLPKDLFLAGLKECLAKEFDSGWGAWTASRNESFARIRP